MWGPGISPHYMYITVVPVRNQTWSCYCVRSKQWATVKCAVHTTPWRCIRYQPNYTVSMSPTLPQQRISDRALWPDSDCHMWTVHVSSCVPPHCRWSSQRRSNGWAWSLTPAPGLLSARINLESCSSLARNPSPLSLLGSKPHPLLPLW